ncbi:MAG TPA: hypothetical protein VMA13_01675 [Candidatus Saccharimonadales bacterium]|nr:hypothetical protein [Candidatus Saccharimonadales bacterium]
MSTIQIGESQHNFCDVTESWLHQQVGRRKDDGQNVCARVMINNGSVNVALSTPECSRSFGVGRKPNEREGEIIRLWDKLHLNSTHWTAGNLVAFVKEARRLVC